MKLEKINDHQIRCTLTGQDLADRQLQLSELAYGTDKAKNLFRDMMQQASYELGFEADDIPLMIEAIPMAEGSLILTVTKVEYPEELDTRFSNFSAFDGAWESAPEMSEPPKLEGSSFVPLKDIAPDISSSTEGNMVTSIQPKQAPAVEVPADIVKLFSFTDLTHIVRLAHVLKDFYDGDNSLFQDPDDHMYYLVLHKSGHTPSEFNKVCNMLSEYAFQNKYLASAEAFFHEHFRKIVLHDALQCFARTGSSISE